MGSDASTDAGKLYSTECCFNNRGGFTNQCYNSAVGRFTRFDIQKFDAFNTFDAGETAEPAC
jgi:hypothetical protein